MWSWTCLPCNVTGTGSSASHVCASRLGYRVGFWLSRFQWAMPLASAEEIRVKVTQPIERTEMVRLLGEKWAA